MILDKELQVSVAQSLTGTSTIASGSVIDLQAATYVGAGRSLACFVEQTASGGSTPTLLIEVVGAASEDLTSLPVVLASRQIANSEIGADKFYMLPGIRPDVKKRYLGVRYTQGGTTPTATVNAYFVADLPTANL